MLQKYYNLQITLNKGTETESFIVCVVNFTLNLKFYHQTICKSNVARFKADNDSLVNQQVKCH